MTSRDSLVQVLDGWCRFERKICSDGAVVSKKMREAGVERKEKPPVLEQEASPLGLVMED